MSRIIRVESGVTRRNRILRAMVLAIRSTATASPPRAEPARDVFAFLALSLRELEKSVEETTAAWERRAYWLKADQFRQEWAWAGRLRPPLDQALRSGSWDKAAACGMELATILAGRKLRVAQSHAKPWDGAYKVWLERHGAAMGPVGQA
jgi:hypothetical protein